MKKRLVLALGGNALQQKGEVTAAAQKAVASKAATIIADLSTRYEIVITHGNGPQVGNILLHEEQAATPSAPAMPLETAVAMSQGQIGYWLVQALDNVFTERHQKRSVVTIITQVLVDKDDPAFRHPSKPIGQFYKSSTALKLAKQKGWVMKEDAGRGYRRLVPSPLPQDIIEKRAIAKLLQSGSIVISVGGGGIPVYRTPVLKKLKGIDAVIDKDFAAAKLANLIQADIFVSVTAVPNAYLNYRQPDQVSLHRMSTKELQTYLSQGHFSAGSMLPKVSAAINFAQTKSRTSIICSLNNLSAALQGKAGTIITA